MSVLLLGSTGTLGRHILAALLRRSTRVTALVRSESKARTLHADLLAKHGSSLTLVVGDASDAGRLQELAPGHAVLINAAGRPHERGNDLGPIVAAVIKAAPLLAAPKRVVMTGGVGALDAPGGHGASGLLPLIPEPVKEFTRVHLQTLASLTAAFPLGGAAATATAAPASTAAEATAAAPPGGASADRDGGSGGSVSWTLFCPGFLTEEPSRESLAPAPAASSAASAGTAAASATATSAPVGSAAAAEALHLTTSIDVNPVYGPTATTLLSHLPGFAAAATFGTRQAWVSIPAADAGAFMAALALAPSDDPCWGHCIGVMRA